MKGAEVAHLVTLPALFILQQEAFLQQLSETSKSQLQRLSKDLGELYPSGERFQVEQAHQRIINALQSMEIMDKMDIFDEAHKNSPMFKVFRQYMRMVLEMLMFLRAVHTADWEVHLKALEIRYLRSISSLIID